MMIAGIISFNESHEHLSGINSFRQHLPEIHKTNKATLYVFQANKQAVFEDEETVCVIKASLHNKKELRQKISIQDKSISDAALLFTYYKQMGESAMTNVCGKWIMLLYNKRSGQISLWRDQMGMYCWYYYLTDEGFYFSDYLPLLLNFANSPKSLSEYYLAGLLIGYTGLPDETAFLSIKKVPAASKTTVQYNNIRTIRYWNPSIKSIRYSHKEQYYEHFNELLGQIIEEMITDNDSIASTVSSGLDSSFLTAFIAKKLENEGKTIKAITSVPHPDFVEFTMGRRYGNEQHLSQQVTARFNNVEHILDNATQIGIMEALQKSLKIHAYPVRNAVNQHWILSLFETLNKQGVTKLFIAQMGNLTVSWPFFDKPKSPIRKLLASLKKYSPYYQLPNEEYYNQDFLHRNQFSNWLKKRKYYPFYESLSLTSKRIYFFDQFSAQGYGSWEEKAAYYGIEVLDPLADVRILNYCFSLPQSLFLQGKNNRLFVKTLAKNLLPEEVINNPRKALQAADISYRLKEEMSEINLLLQELKNDILLTSLFDVETICSKFVSHKQKNNVFLRFLLISLFVKFVTNNQELS